MDNNPQTLALAAAYAQLPNTQYYHGNDISVNVVIPPHPGHWGKQPSSPSDVVPTATTRWARAGNGYPWYFIGWESKAGPLLPQVHTLKTWPQYFEEIWIGTKPFEVRFNDRGYQEGDILILQEYEPGEAKEYYPNARKHDGRRENSPAPARFTGRKLQALVTYVLAHGSELQPVPWAGPLVPGWVVLGIELQ